MSRRRRRKRSKKEFSDSSKPPRAPLTEIEEEQLEELRRPYWRRKLVEIGSLLVSIAGLLRPSTPAPAAPVSQEPPPAPPSQGPLRNPWDRPSAYDYGRSTTHVLIPDPSEHPPSLGGLLEGISRQLRGNLGVVPGVSPTVAIERQLDDVVAKALTALGEGLPPNEVILELRRQMAQLRFSPMPNVTLEGGRRGTIVGVNPDADDDRRKEFDYVFSQLDSGLKYFEPFGPVLHLDPSRSPQSEK